MSEPGTGMAADIAEQPEVFTRMLEDGAAPIDATSSCSGALCRRMRRCATIVSTMSPVFCATRSPRRANIGIAPFCGNYRK